MLLACATSCLRHFASILMHDFVIVPMSSRLKGVDLAPCGKAGTPLHSYGSHAGSSYLLLFTFVRFGKSHIFYLIDDLVPLPCGNREYPLLFFTSLPASHLLLCLILLFLQGGL